MIGLLIALLVLSILLNVGGGIVLARYAKRLLQFDALFQMLVDDIETNVDYFGKLAKTPILENSEEVKSAHKNMVNMGLRLNEFLLRMEEVSNRRLRMKTFKEETPEKDED